MEKTKIEESTILFEQLRKACLDTDGSLFSLTSKTSIQRSCKKINDFCRVIREVKHSSRKDWPQLCGRFDMNARFCKGSNCKILLKDETSERKVIPFLYTYIERVGIMEYHLSKNEYLTSLGLSLGNDRNYKVPLTQQQKNAAGVRITREIMRSKSPRLITEKEELDIYNDIQQKAENSRFLRKMNEFCCFGETDRTSTSDGVGHEKYRYILKKFVDVMEILTQTPRQDSSSEGTNSSVNTIPQSQSSLDSSCNGDNNSNGKRRMSKKEKKDNKKRKR